MPAGACRTAAKSSTAITKSWKSMATYQTRRRERLFAHDVLQQQRMGQQLGQRGRGGHRGVLAHPRTHGGGSQHGQHQRHRIGCDQPREAPPDLLLRAGEARGAARRQAGGGQIAAQHQEHLHGHAAVGAEQGHQRGRQRLGDVGHGPVERQVVPDDGDAGQALGGVYPRGCVGMGAWMGGRKTCDAAPPSKKPPQPGGAAAALVFSVAVATILIAACAMHARAK